MSRVEEAWDDFRSDMMTDPVARYASNSRDVFVAGWRAAQRRPNPSVKESRWFNAPTAPDDDPDN